MIQNVKIYTIKIIGIMLFRSNLYFFLKKSIILIEMFLQDTFYGKKKIREIYARAIELESLISPRHTIKAKKVRIGDPGDGGYVMNEWGSEKLQFISIGVGNNVSWERHLAELGATGTQWDHTVKSSPENLSSYGVEFFKVGLGVRYENHKNFKIYPLEKIIESSKLELDTYKILKIDIEGSEWSVLEKIEIEKLCIFDQILIEFHGLSSALKIKKDYDLYRNVLTSLSQEFNLIHAHANNSSYYLEFKGIIIPNVLEMTFVRNKNIKDQSESRNVDLDFPSKFDWLDIKLV